LIEGIPDCANSDFVSSIGQRSSRPITPAYNRPIAI
jgi:hypothetical protein